MKIDTFIDLIKGLRTNSIADDTDPSNIMLSIYSSPYDILTVGESVRCFMINDSTARVWGNGASYTMYDHQGNPWQMSSCNWFWGAGGRWG